MNDDIIQEISGTRISVVDMRGKLRTFDIGDIFNIDESNISKEFTQQASLYAFFAALAATAEKKAADADFLKDQEYAQADQASREDLEEQSIKYTEAVIKSMVVTDAGYTKRVRNHIIAEYDYRLLKALASALEQRANMLISLGAYLRHELDQTAMNIKRAQTDGAVEEAKRLMRERKGDKNSGQV